jgi:hypothetical protein
MSYSFVREGSKNIFDARNLVALVVIYSGSNHVFNTDLLIRNKSLWRNVGDCYCLPKSLCQKGKIWVM